MEIYHKLQTIDGIQNLIIYVDYPDEYEFSLDFDSFKKNVANVADKIRDYAFKNITNITNDTALLVLNGVIIGTLVVSDLTSATSIQKLNNTETLSKIETSITDTKEETNKNLASNTLDVPNNDQEEIYNSSNNTENTNIKPQTNTTQVSSTPTAKPTPPVQNTKIPEKAVTTSSPKTETISTPSYQDKTVSIKLNSGQIIKISLEDYVVGVVGAEMPGAFQTEALKSQAIVARTYALKRISENTTLSASTSTQSYKTDSELKTLWGSSFSTYYNKIKNAVSSTQGLSITYNGKYIDALYFSTSNGKTEDPINVWGNSFPYLKSTDSPLDKNVSTFSKSISIPISTVCSKLGVNITSSAQIKINSKTIGDRVANVNIGAKNFTGVQVRTLLGLRSADFTVSQSGNDIIFTTKGYGHGVGMSQYGANEMAKTGKTYSDIIYHYYTGVKIVK